MHKKVLLFLRGNKSVLPRLRDQLSRATLSVMLNIAEGSGRLTNADKKRFYVMSRGSVFETVACLEGCSDLGELDQLTFNELSSGYEEISKMLFRLINQ